jgi:hypothetical protein
MTAMTEADWLTCPDPHPMLSFLIQQRASERKLRLFAVACVRRVWDLLPGDRERGVVDIAQQMADGRAVNQDVRIARVRADCPPLHALFGSAVGAADDVSLSAAITRGRGAGRPAYVAERAVQAELLREVFGNPICPAAVDPAWLTWSNHFVPEMARGIYEDRTFHRLPILADALEDAGCCDALILDHLRGPGSHVRGCWALDAIQDTA